MPGDVRFDRPQDFDLAGTGSPASMASWSASSSPGYPTATQEQQEACSPPSTRSAEQSASPSSNTVFFTRAAGSTTGPPTLIDDSRALGAVLLISAGLYVITALVMPALPKSAAAHDA